MPSEGGAPTRLTWPPLGGQVVAWTPDSRRVVFRSRWGVPPAARDQKLYQVGLDASMPEPLPLDRAQSISYAPDGSKALYVRKGNEDYYWKRYKGGQYADIWMADFAAKTFKPVTDYVGRNAYPMWVGDTLFFGSDRSPDGITNLWAQDLKTGAARQVTHYTDFDVSRPRPTASASSTSRAGTCTCWTSPAAPRARSPCASRPTTGGCSRGGSTPRSTSSSWTWPATASRWPWARVATSSTSPSRTRRRCPAT
jgi:tricorn protease